MKQKLVTICLLGCLIMSGCSSKNNNKELEDRISELENELNSLKNSQEDASDNNDTVGDIETDEIINTDDKDSEALESEEDQFSYYIDGLSVDEILEECNYCFNNVPKEGQTFDEYKASLHAIPIKYDDGYELDYKFTKDSVYSFEPSKDIISEIIVRGTKEEMDGSIGYNDDHMMVISVSVYVADYDKATALYDNLFNQLSPKFESVQDQREGKRWSASGMFWDNNHIKGESAEIVSLEKTTNGYILKTSMYCFMDDGSEKVAPENLASYTISDLCINLKQDNKGRDNYMLVSVVLLMNKASDGYATYGTDEAISSYSDIIKSTVTKVIADYTLDEMRSSEQEAKSRILEELQKLFSSDFIYDVEFTGAVYQ